MKKVYFNHLRLVGASDTEVMRLVGEITELKNVLGAIPLYVYEYFWSLQIQSGTLRSFLAHRHNQDSAKVIILALMHNGPHFHDSPLDEDVTITPGIGKSGFGEKLLHTCFSDRQEYILSLSEENVLVHSIYTVTGAKCSISIINILGIKGLRGKLQGQLVFHSIDDVFREITRSYPSIVLLPSAGKSARKHNFKGAFHDVYKTVTALEKELSLLLEGVPDQQRMERFRRDTGCEISGESPEVLQNPKYRKYREFVLGSKGKVLFEWHIKIGNETRIHFFIDSEEKKIYIGHCGKHLPIPSYKS